MLIERNYVDKDYRSTYYNFYAKKGQRYEPDCVRLHFFDETVAFDSNALKLRANDERLTDHYFGFMVLCPTGIATIGRSVVSPDVRNGAGRYIITFDHKVHLLGYRLTVQGFPSMDQHIDMNRTGFLGDLITWEDGVMGRPSRFSPEVRERAVRMVEEHREAHASEWAVLQSVAPKLGCTAETLRKWVRQAQRDAGHRPGLTTSERERLKELEREVRELKRANEILRKASAYFAQAELDRRGK